MDNKHISHSGRQETMLVLADQILVSGSNFFTGLLLARFLGPAGYGQYALTFGMILFLSGLQMAIFSSPMMVKGPALPAIESTPYYRSVFQIQAVFTCTVTMITFFAGQSLSYTFPNWNLEPLIIPLSFVAFFFLMQEFSRRHCFTTGRAETALWSDIFNHGLRLSSLVLISLASELDASKALWIISIASGVGLLLALAQETQGEGLAHLMPWRSLKPVIREHWAFGKWLAANNVAYWCGSQFTIYMIGAVLSVAAVGALNATLSLVGTANILFLSMENLVPRRASRVYASTGKPGLDRYIKRVSIIGGLLTLCIVLFFGVWSTNWLAFLYGDAYKEYSWLVWWWAAYYLIGFFQRPLSTSLRVTGDTRSIFSASLLGAAIGLLASFPAVKYWGLSGGMIVLCLIQLSTVLFMLLRLICGQTRLSINGGKATE